MQECSRVTIEIIDGKIRINRGNEEEIEHYKKNYKFLMF